jgi:GNAT superfamily N-acetyltransferase
MAGQGEAGPWPARQSAVMHAQAFHNRKLGKVVTVRPLANGDTATVAALFDGLSPASRERRYHAAKPRLTSGELTLLAQVGPDSHVLVAHVDGDPLPAGMARLVRDASDRTAGELAFEVADRYQGQGIGKLLAELLLADGRAAGIQRVEAWVQTSNRAALDLLCRVLDRRSMRVEGAETLVVATVA